MGGCWSFCSEHVGTSNAIFWQVESGLFRRIQEPSALVASSRLCPAYDLGHCCCTFSKRCCVASCGRNFLQEFSWAVWCTQGTAKSYPAAVKVTVMGERFG